MTETRKIEMIIEGSPPFQVIDMMVKNYLPIFTNYQRMSPFFMMDHEAPEEFEAITGQGRSDGLHPHRGLETVTIVYEGAITHYDTKGNGGTILKDEAQWMTAGGGIQHTEFPELPDGGVSEMIQLWVLLPQRNKMDFPKYQALTKESIERIPVDGGEVRVLAGDFQGRTGPAKTFTPINLLDIRLKDEGRTELILPSEFNTGIFVVKGAVEVNGDEKVQAGNFILFANEGERISLLSKSEETKLLVMSGEPLKEPIAHRGPFVMNTTEELDQAFKDFRNGLFD